jgi:hypothetical protein
MLLIFSRVAASIEDLYGTFLHLRTDLQGAKTAYENSLSILPLPTGFEVGLKLASIYVEIGTLEEVEMSLFVLILVEYQIIRRYFDFFDR